MERLYFGARARRQARLRRFLFRAGIVSLVAIVLGVPGFDVGLDFLESLTGEGAGVRTARSAGSAPPQKTSIPRRLRAGRDATTPDLSLDPTTPNPPPVPTPTPLSPEIVVDIINSAAAEYGLSSEYLLSVAMCESSLDPAAFNPAGYHGLFQFDMQTWAAFGEGYIYDARAQARTAAELLATGHAFRWPNCA